MEGKKVYDLEERTAKFAEDVIEWLRSIPQDEITKRLINQLAGSSSSVGANYSEADCAESNKDFIHKMSIANKEAKESKHFIRLLAKACPESKMVARKLWKEAYELNLIFVTIIKKSQETEEKKKIS